MTFFDLRMVTGLKALRKDQAFASRMTYVTTHTLESKPDCPSL